MVRGWLARIGETDPATVGEVIEACRRDLDARRYFLGRAGEPAGCTECRHLRRPGGGAWYCCGRSDLPPAYGEGHPLRQIPAEANAQCLTFEPWHRRC